MSVATETAATTPEVPAAESPVHSGPFYAEDEDFVVAVPERDGQATADTALKSRHKDDPAPDPEPQAEIPVAKPAVPIPPTAAAEPAAPGTPAAPRKRGIDELQNRLNHETAQREGERRAREAAEAEVIRLKALLPAAAPAPAVPIPPAAAVFTEPEPTLESFLGKSEDPYADYTKAYAKWSSREAVFQDRQERAREKATADAADKVARDAARNAAEQERFHGEVNAFSTKLKTYTDANPEAAAVLDAWKASDLDAKADWEATHASDQPYPGTWIPPIVHTHLLRSPLGPQIFLHFAEHPESLREIVDQQADGPMLVQLGHVEAVVKHKALSKAGKAAAGAAVAVPVVPGVNDRKGGARSATPPSAASRTSAPAPPPAVGGSPQAAGESDEDLDYDNYRDKHNAREATNTRGRRARPSADL